MISHFQTILAKSVETDIKIQWKNKYCDMVPPPLPPIQCCDNCYHISCPCNLTTLNGGRGISQHYFCKVFTVTSGLSQHFWQRLSEFSIVEKWLCAYFFHPFLYIQGDHRYVITDLKVNTTFLRKIIMEAIFHNFF